MAVLSSSKSSLEHKRYKRWTSEEEEWLRENYRKFPIRQSSHILHRTKAGLQTHAYRRLGLRWNSISEDEKALGYLLGVLDGDGSLFSVIKEHKTYFSVNSIDRDFIEEVQQGITRLTGRLLTIYKQKSKTARQGYYWHIHSHHIRLCQLLASRPSLNKIGIIYYLKGFYDSEGGAYFNEYPQPRRICRRIIRDIAVANSNRNLLEGIRNMLLSLGIQTQPALPLTNSGFHGKRAHLLHLRRDYENFRRFESLIGFRIKRKVDKLRQCIESFEV